MSSTEATSLLSGATESAATLSLDSEDEDEWNEKSSKRFFGWVVVEVEEAILSGDGNYVEHGKGEYDNRTETTKAETATTTRRKKLLVAGADDGNEMECYFSQFIYRCWRLEMSWNQFLTIFTVSDKQNPEPDYYQTD